MKINNYVKDNNVTATDKWIGTDSNSFNQTKNFTPTSLANFYNHNQVIDSPYLKFTYQTLIPGELRGDGTISFETEIGPSIPFSSISTFLISYKSLKGNNVSQYLNFLNEGKIILSRAEDINSFGFYKVIGLTPYVPDTNFFVATLTYIDGYGSMVEDKDYIMSLLLDKYEQPITPTLQQVTDAGNHTTNSITVEDSNYYSLVEPSAVGVENKNTNSYAYLGADGEVGIRTNQYDGIFKTSNLTSYLTLEFPNKTGVKTIATTDDIGSYVPYTGANQDFNLGDNNFYIGSVGNTTFSFIQNVGVLINDSSYNSEITSTHISSFDSILGTTSMLSSDGYLSLKTNTNTAQLRSDLLTTDKIYQLPNNSGTIALTSDIQSITPHALTKTNDTNVTLTLGGSPSTALLQDVSLTLGWTGTLADSRIASASTWNAKQNTITLTTTGAGAATFISNVLNIPTPSLTGFGDMFKSTYDVDNTGVVDNAEAIKIIGRNSTGATLYRGTVVYLNGATGNRPNFAKAQANAESTSAGTFGVIVDDLANNTDGYCIALGYLDNLDTRTTATNPFTTDTLSAGDTIYLSPSTAGYITNVKPSAPNHLVYLGKVTRTSPTNGTIVYRVQNGYELEELHNVAISSVADKQLLSYDNATSLWKNKSVTTADIASSTNKNYVTDAQATVIGNTSGTNTGDQDLSNLVVKNTAITGATKTKITYDAKGLVTSGADATTADIADSTNKRYVTDANLTTIGNQSGTNTGDETTSTIKTKLGAATTSTDGYLTSTNWNTFNSKQASLIYNPYRYLNTTQSTLTGTVTETVVATATIAAGTFNSNDIMKMFFQASKSTTISNVTMRVKIGSTSTFASATTIATYTFLLANGFVTMQRAFSLAGGNINCAAPTSTLLTDVFATSTPLTAVAANPANTLYVFFSVQLGTSGDSVNFTMAYLSN